MKAITAVNITNYFFMIVLYSILGGWCIRGLKYDKCFLLILIIISLKFMLSIVNMSYHLKYIINKYYRHTFSDFILGEGLLYDTLVCLDILLLRLYQRCIFW